MTKRLSECRAFLAFINHIRVQVGCFLKPVRELGLGFRSEPLSECGFIDALSNSESIYEAYKKSEERLSLSADERAVLESLFLPFGEGYLEEEIRIIEAAKEQMEAMCAELSEKSAKNIKLVTVLSVTAALALLLLVI